MFERGGMRAYFAIFLTVLLFCFVQERAFAHGSVVMEKDACRLQLGKYMMHFTGYQPQSAGAKEFCEDIPQTGSVVVVLDAIDSELRELPIEVRIIKDPGERGDAEAVTVLHIAPQRYPTGSISIEHKFDQPGKFVGFVTAGEKGEHVSRFPFSVAISRPVYEKYLLILAVILIGFALYLFSGRARRVAEARARASANKGS